MKSTPWPARQAGGDPGWPVRLFNRSVLKQRKLKEILALLGPSDGLNCLDIGSDNGVISYLLRQYGGHWKSADLDEGSVRAIRTLVQSEVYQIDGRVTPFRDEEFDRVVIVDFLEHIADERVFVEELFRILKPGGELVVNVPHNKDGLLRKLRYALGQTDEKHGHLRPGYTLESIRSLLCDHFEIITHRTYSGFFSELIDTIIVAAVTYLRRDKDTRSPKGLTVTGEDLSAYRLMFWFYSLIYPTVWLFSKLDGLLFFASGHLLILKARANKEHFLLERRKPQTGDAQ